MSSRPKGIRQKLCGSKGLQSHRVDGRPRSVMRSMRRGLFCRCPRCGMGRLFGKFLAISDRCGVCEEHLGHLDSSYSAELGPKFLAQSVITLPIGAALVWLASDDSFDVSWGRMALWTALTLLLAMGMLQPLKGAMIGLQWASRLAKFGADNSRS